MNKHIMTFEAMKIKTLQILEMTQQPIEISNRVKSIKTERRLKSFVKNKLCHLHHWFVENNIDFETSVEIESTPQVSYVKLLKINLFSLLKERRINENHFIQINSLKNRKEINHYIQTKLKKEVPYLIKCGFLKKIPNSPYLHFISVPM